jgi:hypothetical protein
MNEHEEVRGDADCDQEEYPPGRRFRGLQVSRLLSDCWSEFKHGPLSEMIAFRDAACTSHNAFNGTVS